MKKAFVTGITGFAGRHLKKKLEEEGYEVYGITTKKEKKNIFLCDITDFNLLKKILKKVSPSYVFHLAGLSYPRDSFNFPRKFHNVNYIGTLNLFEGIREANLNPEILFISSSEVYGNIPFKKLPIKENCPLAPENPYGVTKAAGELLAMQYVKNYGMKIKIARPFNHYGPYQDKKFVLSNFTSQLVEIEKGKKEAILYTGDLSVKRDFTYVEDVVKAYIDIINKGVKGEAYNVCSNKAYSIEECVKILLSFCKKKVKIKKEEKRMRKGDRKIIYGN